MTSGIYGLLSSTSSNSAALQTSLESRLRARMSTLGSTLYKMTWKEWTTPSQRSRFRLRASVPRTFAIEPTGTQHVEVGGYWFPVSLLSGWVTPTTRDWKDSPGMTAQRDGKDRVDQLPRQAYLAGWGTPTANQPGGTPEQFVARKQEKVGGDAITMLTHQVTLAGWGTPTSGDSVRSPSSAFSTPNLTLNHSACLAGWPTPTAALADKGVRSTEGGLREAMRSHGPDLAASACLAAWPTPAASDAVGGQGYRTGVSMTGMLPDGRKATMGLSPAVKLAFAEGCAARLMDLGVLLTGSDAGMESGGQLNPAHSRWLQALPAVWDETAPIGTPPPVRKAKATEPDGSGPTATRSTRKPRPSSSSA